MPAPPETFRSRTLRATSILIAAIVALATTAAPAEAAYVVLDAYSTPLTQKPSAQVVAVDAQGRTLVGGLFRLPDGNPGKGLARLNVDGSVDTTFQGVCSARTRRAAIECDVHAIAVASDGHIFVAGNELERNSVIAYPFLSKLSPDGQLVPEWSPAFPIEQVFMGFANRLEIRGDILVVLGRVGLDQGQNVAALKASTQGAGIALPFVARLPPGQTTYFASSDAAGNVYAHPNGGGSSLPLVRFNAPSGALDPGFAPFTSMWTSDADRLPLAVPDANAIIVQGDAGMVAIDTSGATLPGWPLFAVHPYTAVPGGVLALGDYNGVGRPIRRIPVAAPASAETIATLPSPSAEVRDLQPRGPGVVLAMRTGDSFELQQADALRVYDAAGVLDPRFSDAVRTIAGGAPLRVGTDIHLAGGFERVGSSYQPFFARFRNGTFDATWQPRAAGFARQLVVSGNRLVGAGLFNDVNGSGVDAGIVGFDLASNGAIQAWPENPFWFGLQVESAIGDGAGGARFFGEFDVQLCGTQPRSFGVHVLSAIPCVVDDTFTVSAKYDHVVDGGDGWLYATRGPFAGPWSLRRFSAATGVEQAGWGASLARRPVALAVATDGVFVALVPDPTDPDAHPVLQRALRVNGAIETAWTSPIRARVSQFESQSGVLFVGGTTLGDTAHYEVWRVNPLTGTPDPAWHVDTDSEYGAFTALDAGTVVVSGNFSRLNGIRRLGLAAYGGEPPLFADSFE